MRVIDINRFKRKIDASKPRPRTQIAKYILKIIYDYDLLNVSDENERAKIFLHHMHGKRMTGKTIARHYKALKPTYFPNATIEPNRLAFDKLASGQRRGVDHNFKVFVTYLESLHELEPDNRYVWPFLFSLYTALRLSELLNLRISHLMALTRHDAIINLPRKYSPEWAPVYGTKFDKLVMNLVELNKDDVTNYVKNGHDAILFKVGKPRNLHFHFKNFYRLATGKEPYLGLGVHSFRYNMASCLNNIGQIELARVVLGHKSVKTTNKYINKNGNDLHDKLENILTKEKFYKELTKDV